ncbi:ABC transporter permease [Bosea caraganae]|nr:ABC transporter permease [Bosea caraganae]
MTSATSTPSQRALAFFQTHRWALMLGRSAVIAACFLAWELASGALASPFFLSSPGAVLALLWNWTVSGLLWRHVGATLLAAGTGYLLGAACGVLAGMVLGLMPRVNAVVAPFISALYALPKIALAPLFVILFGAGLLPKVLIVAITVFFLLLYSTLDGVKDSDRDLKETAEIFGATPSEIVTKILIPGSLPWIFSGLRIAVRYAFTAAILAELIAGNTGIGYLIQSSAGKFNTTGVFAGVLVLVAFSVLFTELLTRTENSALRWRV